VTPLEALDRVVYLLDRSLAPAAKIKAFRNAYQIVAAMAPGEVEQRVAAGTLTDVAGIGKSTGAVIAQAVAGQIPDRITELEATTEVPLSEAGRPYRDALRGDCHSHSLWSDGGATVDAMARTAIDLGHDYLVMTDHSPRLTVAHGLTADRLRSQLDEIRSLNASLAPFRILTGIEVDILEDGSLDQDSELLAQLDVVVASAHSKLRMDRASMTRRLVLAVASPHVDILGHCTGRKLRSTVAQAGSDPELVRPESTFDADLVFAACARFDTAVEINCRPERQDPPDRLLEQALEWECKVSIDTDAHAPGQLEWQRLGCDKAAHHEIDLDRIVNTWSADELVEWAGSHPTS
jgi:putative hydrolase